MLTVEPIDRYQNQSSNVEDIDTNTSTNNQNNIVDIKPTCGGDSEGIAVGGAN